MDKIESIIYASGGGRAPHFRIRIKEGGRGGKSVCHLLSEREAANLVTDIMRNLTLIARPQK